jgi:hypothetical protein
MINPALSIFAFSYLDELHHCIKNGLLFACPLDFWDAVLVISQGVRSLDLRRSRYIGLAKTHLQRLLIAIGMNLVRIVQWLSGDKLASTRQSHFVRLFQPV